MTRPLKAVLLATNLKDYNKIAFDVATSIATHYKAKLILLHVLEKIPLHVESMLVGMVGEEQRKEAKKAQATSVQQSLTGKNVSSAVIRNALEDYCKNSGIDPATTGMTSRETIVLEGDVEEGILKTAKERECGMIVMGAHEGLFTKSSLSSILKNVMRDSQVPVLVVPHAYESAD